MTGKSEPGNAGISAQNSATKPAKKRRGNPDKIKAFQFKPGHSGNPSGRPKDTLSDKARRKLNDIVIDKFGVPDPKGRDYGDLIVQGQITQAMMGNVSAASLLWDRTEGRVPGAGSGEVVPQVNVNVRAEAKAAAVVAEAKGPNLVDRLRQIYGLSTAAEAGVASS